MEHHSTTAYIAIVVLVIFSAYFSATETAFTSLNRARMKNLASDGDRRAKRVLKLSDHYDKLLITLLIGNNIVNVAMTAIATVVCVRRFGDAGATIATVAITVIVLIFGEITPKGLAKESAENFCMFASGLAQVLVVLLTPVNFVFSAWRTLILKLFHVSNDQNITEEELKTLVEEAETEGSIKADQRELIQNAIGFYGLTAEEVMTPRPEIRSIDIRADKEDIAAAFRESGYSRMPVCDDDLDSIQGILNQKDFYNDIYDGDATVSDEMKPMFFVAETMKISTLLKKLQAMQVHMAVVVDEYGGTQGLVTLEDIIEELVGEIYDEHDVIMSREVTELKNGSYRVMCNASLAKVLDFFGVTDESIDANTVNGWVVKCLDKLPQKGDTFEYVNGNVKLRGTVIRATERKALEIDVTVEELPDDAAEESRKGES